ncbi:FadR/GntR family transcriptional regulator [Gemmata sp.]|uniref:FadR/GntR family transcriptional regulator n=1 Tax=Gemmata sp. TaxID=1914242 RepID=UPI003F7280A6
MTRVTRDLESAILTGQFRPGERLPSERALCEQKGVSRRVVREAFGRLEGLGMIESRDRSRSCVTRPSGKDVVVGFQRLMSNGLVTLLHLNEIRLPLETAIARAAARHRTAEHVRRMEGAQAVLGEGHADLEACARADLEFHVALAEASGNPLYPLLLEPVHNLLLENHRQTLGADPGARQTQAEHERILRAVRAGKPALAAAAMNEHLRKVLRVVKDLPPEGPAPRADGRHGRDELDARG